MRSRTKAFTLVELLIVIAVVALWIAVALAARRAVRGEPDLQKTEEPAPQE